MIASTYGVLMHMASGLFSWGMAAGPWHFNVASFDRLQSAFNQEPLSVSHNLFYFSFLSERSGQRMPPAELSALQRVLVRLDRHKHMLSTLRRTDGIFGIIIIFVKKSRVWTLNSMRS